MSCVDSDVSVVEQSAVDRLSSHHIHDHISFALASQTPYWLLSLFCGCNVKKERTTSQLEIVCVRSRNINYVT